MTSYSIPGPKVRSGSVALPHGLPQAGDDVVGQHVLDDGDSRAPPGTPTCVSSSFLANSYLYPESGFSIVSVIRLILRCYHPFASRNCSHCSHSRPASPSRIFLFAP